MAIRARVSVITCCAHSEKVVLRYWLLLMLPLVGLVCIKSDKSDPIFNSRSLDSIWLWPQNQKNYEEKKSVESLQKNRRGSALRWLRDWLSILIGPGLRPLLIGPWFRTVGRERETVRPSWITWTYLDRWWSRDYYFEPHNSGINCTRSLHAESWDRLVFCPKGRYDLVSLIISI